MKNFLLILALALIAPLAVLRADTSCGDEGISCSDNEHCCEHIVAMFANDHAAAPPYVEGRCLPQEQKCSDFWCGNRQCSSGFFGTKSVCCVNTPEVGGTPQYSCAYSELSCPGNSQQLSIRESLPPRPLRRG